MPLFRPQWCLALVSGVMTCASALGWAQTTPPTEPSDEPAPPLSRQLPDNRYRGFRGRDRDRGLSESVRRFGREHQGARVLSAEPVLIHGRSLNRIKSLDADGRVRIWIDDPQSPRTPPRRADDGD